MPKRMYRTCPDRKVAMSNKETRMREVEGAADRLRKALYDLATAHRYGEGEDIYLGITADEAVRIKEAIDMTMTSLTLLREWSVNTVVANIKWQAEQMGYTVVKNA